MVQKGAVMEEKQGWERPGYFLKDGQTVVVPPYDWYGNYGNKKHEQNEYEDKLIGDCKYGFSDHHKLVSDLKYSFLANKFSYFI